MLKERNFGKGRVAVRFNLIGHFFSFPPVQGCWKELKGALSAGSDNNTEIPKGPSLLWPVASRQRWNLCPGGSLQEGVSPVPHPHTSSFTYLSSPSPLEEEKNEYSSVAGSAGSRIGLESIGHCTPRHLFGDYRTLTPYARPRVSRLPRKPIWD